MLLLLMMMRLLLWMLATSCGCLVLSVVASCGERCCERRSCHFEVPDVKLIVWRNY